MRPRNFRFGPIAVGTSAADFVSPGTTTGGVNSTASPYNKLMIELHHIRIVNTTGGAVTFSGFIGAAAGSDAGTEFLGSALSIPANSYEDWDGELILHNADYFSGLGSGSGLTIEGGGY